MAYVKNKLYDMMYAYNEYWGATNNNYKNIDYRIGYTLYHVQGEIGELIMEGKVDGGIKFLKDKISYYKRLDDAESIVDKLFKECNDLNSIQNKLVAINKLVNKQFRNR